MTRDRSPRPGGLARRLLRALRRAVLLVAALAVAWLLACAGLLVAYRWVDPPFTAVQAQRRVEAWLGGSADYRKRYEPVPLGRISVHLPHAVVAAEDTRFWEHGGIDWRAVEDAIDDNRRRGPGRRRGASTLSQQLAKNLFLTTRAGWARKGAEVPLTYLAEWILGKRRILELYLNVAEWGPDGVFGAEAAARHHYGIPAAGLSREQAARLAACLPAPRRRAPQRMDRYEAVIRQRMAALGW